MFCRWRALGRLLFATPHRLSAGACIGVKCARAIRRACRRDERHRSRGAFASESCINRLPSRSKRAQGRPGAGRTHGPPATKKAGGSHHRLGRDTRPSLHDGFNGVLRALPGDRLGTGLCCPHRKQIVPLTWHQRRDARTTRLLRPHWDRSSARLSRAATQHVHRIPLPTSVTTAKRPSHRVRDGADDAPDLGTGSSLFLKIRTCNLRQVGATGKFRMTRMRNLPVG